MKKIVNGEIVEMTAEEIAAMQAVQAELPTPEPTVEERIAALEEQLAATKVLLGVE